MRTIRNVTFVLLCAMVYLAPVQAASSSCSATYLWTEGEGWTVDMYEGECSSSDQCTEGFYFAINYCSQRQKMMVEFICQGGNPEYFFFGCTYPNAD